MSSVSKPNKWQQQQGMCYLLHFSAKLSHAQHYIGFVADDDNLETRLQQHRSGTGAKICRAAVEAGIELHLVRTWPATTRGFERKLKNRKKARCICPQCRGGHGI